MCKKLFLLSAVFISCLLLVSWVSNQNSAEVEQGVANKSSVELVSGQYLISHLDNGIDNTQLYVIKEKTWVLLDDGKIWKTNDAGQNWSRKVFGDNESVGPVSFYNGKFGYALSTSNKNIWHTEDQGETWKKVGQYSAEENADPLFPFEEEIETIHFFNDKYGIAGGGPFKSLGLKTVRMWVTEDGGKNWKEKHNPISASEEATIYDFFFLNRKVGWAVGVNCLLKTMDSGETWQAQPEPIDYRNNKSQWLNENVGWMKSQGFYYIITNDGGKSWKEYNCREGDALYLVTGKEGISLSETGQFFLPYRREGWMGNTR